VAEGVLAHVQPGEVEAEDLDLAQDVVQVARGRQLAPALDERPLGVAQVGQQPEGSS
jgi:hypothetical protein